MKTHVLSAVFLALAAPAMAGDVNITKDMASVTVETPSGPVEIMREQDTNAMIEGDSPASRGPVRSSASSR